MNAILRVSEVRPPQTEAKPPILYFMSNELRIALTGGGTGGHVYPLFAVADEVRHILDPHFTARPYKLFYFGDTGSYRQEFVSRSIKVVHIGASKFRRYMSVLNIVDAIKFPFVLVQAVSKFFFVMPDALFSKGGTGAFPVVFAAWLFRVPVLIHESDTVPGLTNSLSAKFSTRVAVAFEKSAESFSGKKVAVVGNPIRADLIRGSEDGDLSVEQAKRVLGFDPKFPLVLIMGGSQGSRRVNDFILDNAQGLVRKYQVLHQTGADNFESCKHELNLALEECMPEEKQRYKIAPFLKKEMKQAYEACDVIVSRAGSGAIFEAAYFAKPSVLIPLPEAGRNHQYYNAFEYASRGAAAVIEEENLKPALFFDQVDRILSKKETYTSMSEAARSFQTPHAAAMIADEVVRLA